jgi:pyridoxine 5-phosphate synthase
MARIAVDIDPVAIIRNLFTQKVPDPAHVVVLAELGGAESIVCYLREDLKSVNERDVRIIRELTTSHFNVRTAIEGDNVRKLLKIKPDMVTFVMAGNANTLLPRPLILEEYVESLSTYIADFRANNIASSVLIEPEINQVKLAAKLELDYIELTAEKYLLAEDMDTQLAELENLNSIVLAANRLGLGVNISGNLNQESLSDLSKIAYLDDLIVNTSLLVKALSIGVEQAVRDFISVMHLNP